MGRRGKQRSSSSREADKDNDQQEKIETIKAILLTSDDDTWTFWRPTKEEMDQIGLGDDDDDSPAVSIETLDKFEEQLDQIYHMVPQAICTALSNAFAISNSKLAQEVRKVFGDRYETLRI